MRQYDSIAKLQLINVANRSGRHSTKQSERSRTRPDRHEVTCHVSLNGCLRWVTSTIKSNNSNIESCKCQVSIQYRTVPRWSTTQRCLDLIATISVKCHLEYEIIIGKAKSVILIQGIFKLLLYKIQLLPSTLEELSHLRLVCMCEQRHHDECGWVDPTELRTEFALNKSPVYLRSYTTLLLQNARNCSRAAATERLWL
jgi:hypothetical protein